MYAGYIQCSLGMSSLLSIVCQYNESTQQSQKLCVVLIGKT